MARTVLPRRLIKPARAAAHGRRHPAVKDGLFTYDRKNDVDKCKVTGYGREMKIRNFVHKGLKRLYLDDSGRGVPPDTVDKLRKMFAYMDDMQDPEELRMLPAWKVHTLTGDRKGTWSLSVTRNRRLTFRIDNAEGEIFDVNLEDYH